MAIGSTGLSSGAAPPPSDLEAIYQGGEFFLDRMKVLGQQVVAAKDALAELNLGMDTARANAAAVAALADAQAKNDAAAKVLDDAKTKADGIIAAANLKAADMVNSASNSSAKINADADAAKSKSDDYVAKNKAKADAALKDALDQQSSLAAQITAAKVAEQNFIAAKAAQEDATKAAKDQKAIYEKKIAQIQAVIG